MATRKAAKKAAARGKASTKARSGKAAAKKQAVKATRKAAVKTAKKAVKKAVKKVVGKTAKAVPAVKATPRAAAKKASEPRKATPAAVARRIAAPTVAAKPRRAALAPAAPAPAPLAPAPLAPAPLAPAPLAPAVAKTAAPPDGVSERRWHRKLVLDALNKETNVDGGSPEQGRRIAAFRKDPGGASLDDFVFVGALALKNWYVDPQKPGPIERKSLWITLTGFLEKPNAVNPDNWGPDDAVSQLQTIAEVAQ